MKSTRGTGLILAAARVPPGLVLRGRELFQWGSNRDRWTRIASETGLGAQRVERHCLHHRTPSGTVFMRVGREGFPPGEPENLRVFSESETVRGGLRLTGLSGLVSPKSVLVFALVQSKVVISCLLYAGHLVLTCA